MSSAIEVTNVGAIEKLTIPIEPGKVTVLTGPNGAGKSTALQVVKTVAGGGKGELTPRDGKKNGQIRFPGCTITVGARLSKKGDATESYAVIEDGSGIAQLIDPGIKDPQAADRRRIQSLLSAAGAVTNWAEIEEYLGCDLTEEFRAECKSTELVEVVSDLKKWLQKRARTAETAVDTCTGAIEQIGDVPQSAEIPNVDELRSLYTAKSQESRDLHTRFATQQEALKALESIESDVDLQVSEAQLKSLVVQKQSLQASISQQQQRLAVLTSQIETHVQMMEKEKQQVARQQELRKQVEGLVSESQLQEATDAAAKASEAFEAAVSQKQIAEQVEANRAKLMRLKSEREQAEAVAERCRSLSDGAITLLSSAVAEFDGWSIDAEMRLCCEHSRGVIPYGDLSPGERAIRAIQVSMQGTESETGGVPIAAIPQDIWESLDAKNQKLIVQWAVQTGVAVVTAQAAKDESQKDIRVLELF